MKIQSMFHVIRAAAAVTNYNSFLVIGSQAILGYCHDKSYDFSFHESMEIDLVPIPDNIGLSDLISGSIGEMSPFHTTFGYYAHGCSINTAIFPSGWEHRLLKKELDGTTVFFPSPEDIAISKYAAGRPKDLAFIQKLWKDELLDADKIINLIDLLPEERIADSLYTIRMRVNRDIKNFSHGKTGARHESQISR